MIDLIEAVSAALSSAASMVELAVNMKNSDLQHRIADLNVQLANIKNGVAGLQNANSELQDEVARLKADRSSPLVFNQENGFYYAKDEPVPYCPHCYETQKKRVHLIKATGKCPECKESFYGSPPPVIKSLPPQPSRWKIT